MWGLVALCLLAGLLAIPTTGDDEADQASSNSRLRSDDAGANDGVAPGDRDDASGATGGSPVDPGAPAPGQPGSPATSPATPAEATSTTFPPPQDLGSAQDPGPTTPPRAGIYRYRTQAGGETQESTTTVEDKGTDGLGRNQVVIQKGGDFDSTNDVSWRKDALILTRSTFSFGGTNGECDWEPDFLQVRLPLAKGVAWKATSSCMVTGFGPTPIQVTRSLDAKVVDLRRVRIAGRAVDAWVVESTDRFEFAGRTVEQQGSSLFSPKHGLVVSSSGKASVSGPGGTESSDYSTELLNFE